MPTNIAMMKQVAVSGLLFLCGFLASARQTDSKAQSKYYVYELTRKTPGTIGREPQVIYNVNVKDHFDFQDGIRRALNMAGSDAELSQVWFRDEEMSEAWVLIKSSTRYEFPRK